MSEDNSSIQNIFTQLKQAEDKNNQSQQVQLLINLGNIYYSQQKFDRSLNSYQQSLAIAQQ